MSTDLVGQARHLGDAVALEDACRAEARASAVWRRAQARRLLRDAGDEIHVTPAPSVDAAKVSQAGLAVKRSRVNGAVRNAAERGRRTRLDHKMLSHARARGLNRWWV